MMPRSRPCSPASGAHGRSASVPDQSHRQRRGPILNRHETQRPARTALSARRPSTRTRYRESIGALDFAVLRSLTSGRHSEENPNMAMKPNITKWSRALLCLMIFVVAFSFPPSTSHAASSAHGAHHSVSVASYEECHRQWAGKSGEEHRDHGNASSSPDQDDCCDSVCFSMVLDEQPSSISESLKRGKYRIRIEQSASLQPSGLIRPPRILV